MGNRVRIERVRLFPGETGFIIPRGHNMINRKHDIVVSYANNVLIIGEPDANYRGVINQVPTGPTLPTPINPTIGVNPATPGPSTIPGPTINPTPNPGGSVNPVVLPTLPGPSANPSPGISPVLGGGGGGGQVLPSPAPVQTTQTQNITIFGYQVPSPAPLYNALFPDKDTSPSTFGLPAPTSSPGLNPVDTATTPPGSSTEGGGFGGFGGGGFGGGGGEEPETATGPDYMKWLLYGAAGIGGFLLLKKLFK